MQDILHCIWKVGMRAGKVSSDKDPLINNNQAEPPTKSMSGEKKTVVQIATVVLSYWTISISMVFANKYLLGGKHSESDISLFVAWFQCLVTVFSVIIGTYTSRICRGSDAKIPLVSQKVLLSKNMLILSALFVGMLTFNNLCLKHVGVAFFQVARSLTLIFTVIFSALILGKPQSKQTIGCCLIVVSGFCLGVNQEGIAGTLSYRGVIYGVTTSLFVSLVGIFTKRALELVEKDVVKVTFYNNVNSAVMFIPLVIATSQLMVVFQEKSSDITFWIFLILSGMLSFLIGWASNMQIDYTSPITHHISNNTKAVLQTVIAVLWYQETKLFLWWCSNLLVITGAFLYAMVKMREQRALASSTATISAMEAGENDTKNGVQKA
ncbi:GDP-fucose transporter-like isoform X2 [Lineus longissimus]|uniref:GDP-fucose transporter-like isoform X2 n=1 Tax=Lineus longissimus TaxID=88925 RepID=UPI00315CC12E